MRATIVCSQSYMQFHRARAIERGVLFAVPIPMESCDSMIDIIIQCDVVVVLARESPATVQTSIHAASSPTTLCAIH